MDELDDDNALGSREKLLCALAVCARLCYGAGYVDREDWGKADPPLNGEGWRVVEQICESMNLGPWIMENATETFPCFNNRKGLVQMAWEGWTHAPLCRSHGCCEQAWGCCDFSFWHIRRSFPTRFMNNAERRAAADKEHGQPCPSSVLCAAKPADPWHRDRCHSWDSFISRTLARSRSRPTHDETGNPACYTGSLQLLRQVPSEISGSPTFHHWSLLGRIHRRGRGYCKQSSDAKRPMVENCACSLVFKDQGPS